ncbi:MAG TPA: hypothetical protein VMD77_02200 [Candidatus Baltobacteraceae bacterium]|nr:hypothetical protein [Verrucomicrobiae bacterium]HTX14078.1 hypothetical protein [Candidatus Baltobacteraceae bacterium]
MYEVQRNANLAYQIGLCRIAMAVDQFCDQVRANPDVEEPFDANADWGDHKARMTYFWWVALGGDPIGEFNLEIALKQGRAGQDVEMLSKWLNLFRESARSVMGKELAEAWMQNVLHLGYAIQVKDKTLASRN